MMDDLPMSFWAIIAIVVLGLLVLLAHGVRSSRRNIRTLRELRAGERRTAGLGTGHHPDALKADDDQGPVDRRVAEVSDHLELGRYGPAIMKKYGLVIVISAVMMFQLSRILITGGSMFMIALSVLMVTSFVSLLGIHVTKLLVEAEELRLRGQTQV